MQIKVIQGVQYLSIFDNYNNVKNEIISICSKTGWGKGLSNESITEEFHQDGYTILNIADPKDELEMAYAMFEPIESYHTSVLHKIGKEPSKKKVKLYHPFTFNIPKGKQPDFNFYTIPITDLGREEWTILLEKAWDTDVIKLLLGASQSIDPTTGLYGFIHHLSDLIMGKSENTKQNIQRDPSNFNLKVTSGTAKSIQDISNYLRPFHPQNIGKRRSWNSDSFLSPQTSPHKLNWKEILNDQEHYHCFTSHWIKDPKTKEFLVLYLLQKIIQNKQHARKPILIVMPEIKILCPYKPQGYHYFLSNHIEQAFSKIRSMGSGMSAIWDTQSYSGVDEKVAGTGSYTLWGEITNINDLDKIGKRFSLKSSVKKTLSSMQGGNSTFLIGGMMYEDPIKIFPPSHRHCEPKYNFFKTYQKEYPERMKEYNHLKAQIKTQILEEENKINKIIKKRQEKAKKERESQQKAKQQNQQQKTGVTTQLEKAKQQIQSTRLEKMRLAYEKKQENPSLSERALARDFGVDNKTIKRWLIGYKKHLDQQKQQQDSTDIVDEILQDPNFKKLSPEEQDQILDS